MSAPLVFTITVQPGDSTKFLRSQESIARSIERKIQNGMYEVTTGKLPMVTVKIGKDGER